MRRWLTAVRCWLRLTAGDLVVGEGELAAEAAQYRIVRVRLAVLGDDLGGVGLRVVLRLVAERLGLGQRDPAAAGVGGDAEGDAESGPFGGQAGFEEPARVAGRQPAGQHAPVQPPRAAR